MRKGCLNGNGSRAAVSGRSLKTGEGDLGNKESGRRVGRLTPVVCRGSCVGVGSGWWCGRSATRLVVVVERSGRRVW